MKPAKAIRTILIVAVILAVLVGIAYAVVFLTGRLGELTAESDRCVTTVGDHRTTLSPTQAHYASIIVGIAVQRRLPDHAATVAIATAYQESKIVNIDYGDRDSLGLFQQRPSQGWGTPEQVMDPYYATNAFYDALLKVKGWQQMEVTKAAQAVQRSGFPEAYAQHETNARTIGAALTGQQHGVLTCLQRDVKVGDAYALSAFITATFGPGVSVNVNGTRVTISTPDAKRSWAVAQALVANYARYAITSVLTDGQRWTPQNSRLGTWETSEPTPATTVTLTLAE